MPPVRFLYAAIALLASVQTAGAVGYIFQSFSTASVNGTYDVHAVDLDGDGRPEVLSAAVGSLKVIKNDGTGHLTTVSTYSSVDPRALAVKDFNGDGKVDMK